MKIWGWWRKDESSQRAQQPVGNERQESIELLDDLPPKFEDHPEEAAESRQRLRLSLRRILRSISTDDFKAIPQMPCFRSAMLNGLGMSVVAGSIIFAARRSLPKATNWMVGGFIVGSVVTWEQCRFRISRGRRNMEQAQEAWRHRGEGGEKKSDK